MYSAHGASIAPRQNGGRGILMRTRQSKRNAKIMPELDHVPDANGIPAGSAPGFLTAGDLPIGCCCKLMGGNGCGRNKPVEHRKQLESKR